MSLDEPVNVRLRIAGKLTHTSYALSMEAAQTTILRLTEWVCDSGQFLTAHEFEIEFPDGAFLRFGTDPTRMVYPLVVASLPQRPDSGV